MYVLQGAVTLLDFFGGIWEETMSVKIHAMPLSQTAVGPVILAAHSECGGLEMVDLFQGAHKTEEFTKLNAYQHIPTLEDGDFSLGESNAILRYLAGKYKPELYPVAEPELCGTVGRSRKTDLPYPYPFPFPNPNPNPNPESLTQHEP